MSKIASHKGVVIEKNGNALKVKIESVSACAACHAKSMCTMSDKEDKIIDLSSPPNRDINLGDTVTVCVSKEKGMQAVVLAYLIPVAVVILALVMLLNYVPEPLAILLSLASLGMYYLLLYCFRSKLNSKFTMYISDN